MEIVCESCKAKLNIPDEKIPKGQAVRISCPKCKKKIVLETGKFVDPEAGSESVDTSETEEFRLSFIDQKPAAKSAEESYG